MPTSTTSSVPPSFGSFQTDDMFEDVDASLTQRALRPNELELLLEECDQMLTESMDVEKSPTM
ncbi:hypothetical protein FRB99_005499 [Tulasnella sp. 403]|nr:hypothetical protein FRB99_005499 [Tulasnella sp. 403]